MVDKYYIDTESGRILVDPTMLEEGHEYLTLSSEEYIEYAKNKSVELERAMAEEQAKRDLFDKEETARVEFVVNELKAKLGLSDDAARAIVERKKYITDANLNVSEKLAYNPPTPMEGVNL